MSLLFQYFYRGQYNVSATRIVSGLLSACLLSLVLQSAIMSPLTLLTTGDPLHMNHYTLLLWIVLISIGFLSYFLNLCSPGKGYLIKPVKLDWLAQAFFLLYALVFPLLLYYFKPEKHISTGVHQELGPCADQESFVGIDLRNTYVCDEHLSSTHVISLNCGLSSGNSIWVSGNDVNNKWYTLCGRAFQQGEKDSLLAWTVFYASVQFCLVTLGLSFGPAISQVEKHKRS